MTKTEQLLRGMTQDEKQKRLKEIAERLEANPVTGATEKDALREIRMLLDDLQELAAWYASASGAARNAQEARGDLEKALSEARSESVMYMRRWEKAERDLAVVQRDAKLPPKDGD